MKKLGYKCYRLRKNRITELDMVKEMLYDDYNEVLFKKRCRKYFKEWIYYDDTVRFYAKIDEETNIVTIMAKRKEKIIDRIDTIDYIFVTENFELI